MVRHFLERILRRTQPKLVGSPASRREKTYAAATGYVYHYSYAGYRPVTRGTEYVFDVAAGGAAPARVTVLLESAAVTDWESAHGRPLAATERYAIAKMSLFHAFDERAMPALLRAPVRVRSADASAVLDELGVD